MKWAIKDNIKVESSPDRKAICPLCKEEVISKCGDINVWHWAHKNKKDCDSWWEPESEWHKDWKSNFPIEQQEFIMGRHRADIRTKDRWIIELQNSTISSREIIEREEYYKRMIWLINGKTLCKGLRIRNKDNKITFRWKSPPKSWWVSKKDIYIDMSGIVDVLKTLLNDYCFDDKKHLSIGHKYESYEYYTEYGEHMVVDKKYPTSYRYDTTDIEIKKIKNKIKLLDNKIFLIKKIYNKIPCGGYGVLISKEEFLNKFI